MYPLLPLCNRLERVFLAHWLLSDGFTRQASSHQQRTGIPKINRQQLGMIPVPVPPVGEQSLVGHMLSTLDRKVDAEERRKKSLEALFKSLLEQLMTGARRVGTLA